MWENIDDSLASVVPLPGPPTANDTLAVRQLTDAEQLSMWWRLFSNCDDSTVIYCGSLAPEMWLTSVEPVFEQAFPIALPTIAEVKKKFVLLFKYVYIKNYILISIDLIKINDNESIWKFVGSSKPDRDNLDKVFS